MARNTRKNINRRNRRNKRTYTKKGGDPQKKPLKNEINKLVRDEFAESFVVAADIGRSPTAPEEQAKRTLLLRESRKGKNKIEKKSKVSGIQVTQKSEGGLASAIKAGYAQGLTAASTVKSRGQSALSTLGGITGALGGPTKIPTSFSNIKQLGSQLLPQDKGSRRQGRSGSTRRTSSTGRRTRKNSKDGAPPLPGEVDTPPLPGEDDTPPLPEESDNVQSTGDELPPPPPESKAEVCPVCSNGVNNEIKIKDITKALREMAKGKIDDMEDDDSIDQFVKNELLENISEVQKEVNEKRADKKKEIQERKEKKEAEEKKKRNEKARKLKEKLEDIKGKCSAVGDIKEGDNNSNTTQKLSDLLKELESAVKKN